VAVKSSSRRPEQVAETVRQVVTGAFAREQVRDPRIQAVTVTAVRVSRDLSHAQVLVMVPGDEVARAKALEGLQSAAKFLRGRVAKALTTRIVPELHFELDRGQEHARRIETLLQDIRRESDG
jgi:ribosome-binding factor A